MRAQPFTASVEYAGASVRADFIRRTYQHLAWAVLGFIVVEALLLQWSGAQGLVRTMTGGYSWLIVLAAFMGVSWLAEKWAHSGTSPQMQYAGLALFVVAEAIIFLPLLYIAAYFSSPNVIPTAGIVTALLFGGLTYIAFTTRRDFSFLGNILSLGGFVALGVIVASMLFGLNLGVFFAGLMVAYAGAAILYNTSNIMHEYRPDQHVAAALALFASVALLFWYVLRIVMAFTGDDD
jgi:FtsH-binding integral membrane protein